MRFEDFFFIKNNSYIKIAFVMLKNKQKYILVYQIALIRTFHTRFDYKITFVNSQHEETNSKGDFILKNRF